MSIVIDTSAILAVVTYETHRERLIEVTVGGDLMAPQSVHWEIGNALSAMLKRDRVTLQQALDAFHAYERIPIRYVDVEITEALTIADRWDLYACDAYLLRCAEKYHAPLLSLDKGLLRVATRMGIDLVEV